MSEMLTRINRDKIEAMKAKDRTKKDILVMIINDATNIAKNDTKTPGRPVTDADVIEAAQKTVKRARDMKEALDKAGTGDHSAADNEIEVAHLYLPRQMTEAQIEAVIDSVVGDQPISPKLRGPIMKTLNEKHKGEFDNLVVKAIVDRKLAV